MSCRGRQDDFFLVLVLFILLVIVGASNRC